MSVKKNGLPEEVYDLSAESIELEPADRNNLLSAYYHPNKNKSVVLEIDSGQTVFDVDENMTPSFGPSTDTPRLSCPEKKSIGQRESESMNEEIEKTKSMVIQSEYVGKNDDEEESDEDSVDLEAEAKRFGMKVERLRQWAGIFDQKQSQIVPISKRTRMHQKKEAKMTEKAKPLPQRTFAKIERKVDIKDKDSAIRKNQKVIKESQHAKIEPKVEPSKRCRKRRRRGRRARNMDKTHLSQSNMKAQEDHSQSSSSDSEQKLSEIREVRKIRLQDMTCLITTKHSMKEVKLSDLARDNPDKLINYLRNIQ